MGAFEERLEDIDRNPNTKFYVLILPARHTKTAQGVLDVEFPRFAQKIGRQALAVMPVEDELSGEIRCKFELKEGEGDPTVLIIDVHPMDWKESDNQALRIELGRINERDAILDILMCIEDLLAQESFLSTVKWTTRKKLATLAIKRHSGSILSLIGLG